MFSFIYFIIIHFWINKLVLLHTDTNHKINILLVHILTILLAIFLTMGTGAGWIYVSVCTAIYFNVIYFSKLSITLLKIRYITYFYIFTFVLFLAIIISCAIYKVEYAKRATKTKVLATKVSRSQPKLDLMFISSGIDTCTKDSLVLQILTDTIQNRADLELDLIKKNFSTVSERYETKFYFYNKHGNGVSEQLSKNFFSIQKMLNKPALYTKFKHVFKFEGDIQGYFAWRPILDSVSNVKGYLLIEFRLRKLIPNSIYTELFTKLKYTNDYNYSYALYVRNKLVSLYNQNTTYVPFQ